MEISNQPLLLPFRKIPSTQYILFILLVLVPLIFPVAQANIGCVDSSGHPVEWWVMLKSSIVDSKNPIADDGFAFVYLDSNTVAKDSKFNVFPDISLKNNSHALAHTLKQLYDTPSSNHTGHFMYNDETPDGKRSEYYAHAKGVSMFDQQSGFWLVHSTPRYPHGKDGSSYGFPDNERIYGQSFLCLSLDASNVDNIGLQLSYMNPQLYEQNMPSSLENTYPKLTSMLNGNHHTTPGAAHIKYMNSIQGEKWISFAKNAKWGQDLYSDLVCPEIEDGLYLETWMRPYRPSCCKPKCDFPNINVKKVALTSDSQEDLTFTETKDHSKWGISVSSTWVCIGGINRNKSQWNRGGGTVCTKNGNLWKAFKRVIEKADDSCNV